MSSHAFHAELSLEVARARRYRAAVALVLFEVDCSRQPDDRGRVRRAFGAALAGSMRETDAAARVGGDEFAALLPAAELADADAFVARLRRELSEGLSISVGAACFPAECATVEQLLEKAERRLYSDKAARAA